MREGQLYAQPYKNGRWEAVKVALSKEELLVLKRDVVHEDTMASNVRYTPHSNGAAVITCASSTGHGGSEANHSAQRPGINIGNQHSGMYIMYV